MGEFLQVCPKRLCISTVGKRTDLFPRDPFKVPITDFFGSVRNVELTSEVQNLTSITEEEEAEVPVEETKSKKNLYHYPELLPIFKELERSL